MLFRVTPAAAVVLAAVLTACSSSHGASGSQQSAATQVASPQAAAATGAPAQGAPSQNMQQSGATGLPVYPGAVKTPTQMQRSVKMCGSVMSMTLYRVANANADTVSKWYGDRMANAIHMSVHSDTGTTAAKSQDEVFFSPDGSSSAMVMQLHLTSPNLAAAGKTIGVGETTIGLNTYNPPFSPDVVRAMQQEFQGDAAAKAAARATVKAKCGSDFATIGE